MSEETENTELDDMMIDSTEDILEDARSGHTTSSVEVMAAVLHRVGRSPALAYVVIEHGDDVGHDELRDFCEEAFPHMKENETLTVESYNLAHLLTAFHAVKTGGGEE